VALRARDLRLDHIHQGIADKLTVFREILRQEKLSAEQAAYMGDDIIDLPVMQHCGLAIAVPNSRVEVLQAAHFVTEHPGGHGAVRDAVEFILRAQGKLQQVMDSYLQGRSPEKKTGKK
jgi:3-deoxy-D-manno-octulosonate 8-phosphate phosphatase (KDO 8-P phosphatase)